VSNIKNSKDFLWYRLNHDALTGLPNQSYLLDKVGDLKEVSSNNCYSLVYIDIDRFKEINDHLGHQIGDQVIKEVAIRIQNVLPSNAWLCHLGGDKFAILLQNPKDVNYARDLCTKIKSALNPVFSFNTSSISIKTSIAYLLFSSNRDFLNNVLLQAELLIREARISGDSDVLEWTKEFAAIQRKKADIKNSLADAFVLGQFVPYFQPIVNLQNRKIEKAEFLIRWQHPEFGLLNPNEFISIAEQSGYILKIGAWCRQQSIRYCKKWVELFKYPFQISINKSPVELIDADVESSIHHFVNQIEEAGLSGSNFAFELTESILVEDAFTVTRKINQIVEAGIKLSIDDFGTGFSSLSYLDRFPFDFIKLDISFIEDLQTGSNKEVLCKHIIAMAHQLGIAVVAEGVETSDQESVLIDLGCDYAQGFLYSPPLNAKDFGLLLERNFNVS